MVILFGGIVGKEREGDNDEEMEQKDSLCGLPAGHADPDGQPGLWEGSLEGGA